MNFIHWLKKELFISAKMILVCWFFEEKNMCKGVLNMYTYTGQRSHHFESHVGFSIRGEPPGSYFPRQEVIMVKLLYSKMHVATRTAFSSPLRSICNGQSTNYVFHLSTFVIEKKRFPRILKGSIICLIRKIGYFFVKVSVRTPNM